MAQYYADYENAVEDLQHEAQSWPCTSCGFMNNVLMPVCERCNWEKDRAAPNFQDLGTIGVRGLFLGECRIRDHCTFVSQNREAYLAELNTLLYHGVALSSPTRAAVAAVVAAYQIHEFFDRMLPTLSIPELLATLKILDAPRRVRQLKRRLQFLEQHNARKITKTAVQKEITHLETDMLDRGNLTGALVKKVKKHIYRLEPEQLEFFMLNMPKEPWKEMSDLCHMKSECFTVPHFLRVMFGDPAPENTLVHALQNATAADLIPLLRQYPILATCYSFIRTKFRDGLDNELKLELARVCPLEDVLWWYEELNAPGVQEAVHARLLRGDQIVTAGRSRSSYGKLMERLLTFRAMNLSFVEVLLNHAQEKLNEIHIDASCKVCVLGDASGSMEVAIKTATIIASSLCVCLKAELMFFHSDTFAPPIEPKTVADVLAVTEQVNATGSTSPAAALWPYYEAKKFMDLFVVVTDEEENTNCHGHNFAELFEMYRRDVNSRAQVFFVSFLTGPDTFVGQMRAALRTKGIGCKQFRLNPHLPDLSKLPNLFASLALETGGRMLDAERQIASESKSAAESAAVEAVPVAVAVVASDTSNTTDSDKA